MAKRSVGAESALHNLTRPLSPAASLHSLLNGSRTLGQLHEWETDFRTAARLLTRIEQVDLAVLAAMRRVNMTEAM